MKKIIIEFIIIFTTLLLLFKYNIQIKNNLNIIFYEFVKNVIPSMFPILFISNLIKNSLLDKNDSKFFRFISLIFSYAPSNAILASNEKELLFSTVINPLFSYSVMINFFSVKNTLIIIFINITINCIFLFKNITKLKTNSFQKKNITTIINETSFNIVNIFGTVIFFNIVISILSVFISSDFLFLIEITNGFNVLKSVNNIIFRDFMLIFLNSFGGIAIFFQIKSINNDASYLLIFKKMFVSLIISIITILIMSLNM